MEGVMKSKTFLVLLAVCAVLVLASLLVFQSGEDGTATTPEGADFFANLPVNDVTGLTLSGPEGEVVLAKGGTVWRVENRYGYPADFDDIREFILKVRDLKVGRTFTADADSRRRLSLLPPDAEGADAEHRGTRVVLQKGDDTPVADLIIGNARETDTGSGGHYLRRADGDTVFLVDESFRFLELDPAEWLAPDLLDISAADVRRVTCLNPTTGQELYRIERPEKGQPPVFIDPAPGDQTVVPSKITNLFSALDNLTLEDVADPETEAREMGLETPLCHEFWLFDGTTYTVCKGRPLPEDENQHYLRATAGYRAPPEPAPAAETESEGDAPDAAEAEVAPTDEETAEAAAEETDEAPDPAQVAAEAEQKNEALSKWTFVVPKWKVGRLETDVEEFFETPEPAASETPPENGPAMPSMEGTRP